MASHPTNTAPNDPSGKKIVEGIVEDVIVSMSSHLADWIRKHKNVEINTEDVYTAFNVPFKPPITPGLPAAASITMPNMPGWATGNNNSPKSKKGGRQKKTYSPNHPKCDYSFTRGKKEGNKCDAPVLLDGSLGAEKYCKNCLKKAAVKNKLNKQPNKLMVNSVCIPGDTISVGAKKENLQDQLEVFSIEGHDGLYREAKHGFIVKQEEDGNIYVLHIERDKGGKWEDLTDTEKDIAQKMCLSVMKSDVEVPEIPQVPVIEVLES